MITSILGKLYLAQKLGSSDFSGIGNLDSILNIFQISKMVPPYYLQIAIGIYIVEIIFILTGALVTINSGYDKLEETYSTGRNLKRGILLYLVVALLAILGLFILSSVVLGGLF